LNSEKIPKNRGAKKKYIDYTEVVCKSKNPEENIQDLPALVKSAKKFQGLVVKKKLEVVVVTRKLTGRAKQPLEFFPP
jgi:hypothetical protein